MRGNNPIRPPVKGDGSVLDVVRIFPTLQGEGPNTGHAAVFVRLGGCNLACDFCDTEFEEFRAMGLEEIVREVKRLAQSAFPLPCNHWPAGKEIDLAVLTGGEPLRQPIGPLCAALLAEGMRVQIETNGTLWRELPEAVEIVCSPKNANGGYHALRGDLLARVGALKFVVSATHPRYRGVGEVGQAGRPIPVYVQPMDERDEEKNRVNAAHAVRLAARHGYRLSLQTHKLLGID